MTTLAPPAPGTLVAEPGICTVPRTPPTHVWVLQLAGRVSVHATEAGAVRYAELVFFARHGDDPSLTMRRHAPGLFKVNRVTRAEEWFGTIRQEPVR